MMRGDGGIDEIATDAPQARQCAFLIRPRESAVTDNVGDQVCSELARSPLAHSLGVTQNSTRGVAGEQVKEDLVGLRVLTLELQSASASTIVSEAGPALALEPVGQGAACLPELLGVVAAAARRRDDQRTRHLRVSDAEVQRTRAAHRQPADVRLLDAKVL